MGPTTKQIKSNKMKLCVPSRKMILQRVLPRSVRIAQRNTRSEVLVNRSVFDVFSTDKSKWHRSGEVQSTSIADYHSTITQLDTSRPWLQLSATHHGRNALVESPQTMIIQNQCPKPLLDTLSSEEFAENIASKEKDECFATRLESSAPSANGTHDRSTEVSSNGETDIYDMDDDQDVLRCYEELKAVERMGAVEACHLRIKHLEDGMAKGHSVSNQHHFIAAMAKERKFLLTVSSNERRGDPQWFVGERPTILFKTQKLVEDFEIRLRRSLPRLSRHVKNALVVVKGRKKLFNDLFAPIINKLILLQEQRKPGKVMDRNNVIDGLCRRDGTVLCRGSFKEHQCTYKSSTNPYGTDEEKSSFGSWTIDHKIELQKIGQQTALVIEEYKKLLSTEKRAKKPVFCHEAYYHFVLDIACLDGNLKLCCPSCHDKKRHKAFNVSKEQLLCPSPSICRKRSCQWKSKEPLKNAPCSLPPSNNSEFSASVNDSPLFQDFSNIPSGNSQDFVEADGTLPRPLELYLYPCEQPGPGKIRLAGQFDIWIPLDRLIDIESKRLTGKQWLNEIVEEMLWLKSVHGRELLKKRSANGEGVTNLVSHGFLKAIKTYIKLRSSKADNSQFDELKGANVARLLQVHLELYY